MAFMSHMNLMSLIDNDAKTQSEIYYVGALMAVLLSARTRNLLVKTKLDAHLFNILVTPVIHVMFMGISPLMHMFVSVMAVYLMHHGAVHRLVTIALLMGHVTFLLTSFETSHYLAPTAHMMLIQRALYYMNETHPASLKRETNEKRDTANQDTDPDQDLVSYLAYMFEPAGFFAGPTLNYTEFKNLPIEAHIGTMHHIQESASWTALYAVGALWSMNNFTLNVKDSTVATLLGQVFVQSMAMRIKYYAVWSLTKTTALLYHYNVDQATNVYPQQVSLATNFKQIIRSWNRSTQRCLYQCVYKPLRNHGYGSQMASLLTFVASAAWHGPRFRYLFSMVPFGFIKTLQSKAPSRTSQDPVGMVLLQIVKTIMTQFTISFILAPFMMDDMETITVFMQRTWFVYVGSMVYARYM